MLGVIGNIRFGHFKNGVDLFLGDRREILDELLDGVASLQVIEQR